MATPAEFFNEFIRYEIELFNAVDRRLRADHDLPLTRFEPMQVVSHREACRVQDIARDLVITVGGASKLVDRIEGSGYCRRRPNPEDQRSSLIELTSSGRRLLAAASVSFDAELESRVGTVLSTREMGRLTGTLRRLRRAGYELDE